MPIGASGPLSINTIKEYLNAYAIGVSISGSNVSLNGLEATAWSNNPNEYNPLSSTMNGSSPTSISEFRNWYAKSSNSYEANVSVTYNGSGGFSFSGDTPDVVITIEVNTAYYITYVELSGVATGVTPVTYYYQIADGVSVSSWYSNTASGAVDMTGVSTGNLLTLIPDVYFSTSPSSVSSGMSGVSVSSFNVGQINGSGPMNYDPFNLPSNLPIYTSANVTIVPFYGYGSVSGVVTRGNPGSVSGSVIINPVYT